MKYFNRIEPFYFLNVDDNMELSLTRGAIEIKRWKDEESVFVRGAESGKGIKCDRTTEHTYKREKEIQMNNKADQLY